MPMSVMSDLTPRGLNVRFVRIWPGETNCWDLNGVGSSLKILGELKPSKAVAGEYDCYIWMIGSV
jgi:hypothetical protein